MARQWKQANAIIDEQVAARRAAGLPEPARHHHPLIQAYLGIFASTLPVALVFGASAVLSKIGAIQAGIVVIVLVGSFGQALRGLGEQRQSCRLKATGYYLGASAYLVTATVALLNGVPRLIAG